MEHLALTWAAEADTMALRVNLFEPPPMRTRLRATAYPGEDRALRPDPATIAPALLPLCLPTETRNGVRVTAGG
jgi:hypothetical protein